MLVVILDIVFIEFGVSDLKGSFLPPKYVFYAIRTHDHRNKNLDNCFNCLIIGNLLFRILGLLLTLTCLELLWGS